jgi:hypothetical protein
MYLVVQVKAVDLMGVVPAEAVVGQR